MNKPKRIKKITLYERKNDIFFGRISRWNALEKRTNLMFGKFL